MAATDSALARRLATEDVPMDGGATLIPVGAVARSGRLQAAYLGDEAPLTDAARAAQDRAAEIRPVELVQACIEGEDGAWESFVQRYAPLVHAIARRSLRARGMSPSQEDLDDVCENTILALVKDDFALLRSYDDRYALSTFVGVIARTQAGRFGRRRRLGGSDVDPAELPSRVDDPALQVEARDQEAALRATLDEMPERDRKILELFYFNERDYREIAAELKISTNSVGAALHRARERLKSRLEALGRAG